MSALDNILANFQANKGRMPQVNPPAAATVLETQTRPETEGKPEPSAVAAAAALTSSPATSVTSPTAVSSAPPAPTTEAAPVAEKTRRTAAVVQAELDAALAENVAEVNARAKAEEALAAERVAHDATKAELEKAMAGLQEVLTDNARLSESAPAAAGTPADLEGLIDALRKKGLGVYSIP